MNRASKRVVIKPIHFDEINDDNNKKTSVKKLGSKNKFKSIWKQLKDDGWTSRIPPGELGTLYHYIKPNVNVMEQCVENVDYFNGEVALLEYVKRQEKTTFEEIIEEQVILCASGELCTMNYVIEGRSAHACITCRSPCHAICGESVGEEGYGGSVVCFKCKPPSQSNFSTVNEEECIICKRGWSDGDPFVCDVCLLLCHYVCGEYLHEGRQLTCNNCVEKEKPAKSSKKKEKKKQPVATKKKTKNKNQSDLFIRKKRKNVVAGTEKHNEELEEVKFDYVGRVDEEEVEVDVEGLGKENKNTFVDMKNVGQADFDPITPHKEPTMENTVSLLQVVKEKVLTPYDTFSLFFDDAVLERIVIATNKYAESKDAFNPNRRVWEPVTVSALKIYLGVVMFMGVWKMPATEDYWKSSEEHPLFPFARYMSLLRFQQIKRYFHVVTPKECSTEPDTQKWYHKVDWLMEILRNRFKKFVTLMSYAAVDEMMVRFFGRSAHTTRMRSKPIKEGYKIWSLCSKGYTWTFEFDSRVLGIKKAGVVELQDGMAPTQSLVYHLCDQLPFITRFYHVFMDNLFSNIPLFHKLRSQGIGATGTVRVNSSRFPKEIKTNKKFRCDWDVRASRTVDDVLAFFWMDNGPVHLMTTMFPSTATGGMESVLSQRRRPRETSSNAVNVRKVFGEKAVMEVPIPIIIHMYNNWMNGVDRADQLRSYYCLQMITGRVWMPLWFWLLDTAIVNAYIIYGLLFPSLKLSHKDFRLQVAWGLVKDGVDPKRTRSELLSPMKKTTVKRKTEYCSKNANVDLPLRRLDRLLNHFPTYTASRVRCYLCRWKKTQTHYIGGRSTTKAERYSTNSSYLICNPCGVHLCCQKDRNCFKEYHELEDF